MIKEKMDQVLKKVAAINDLSCLGGASLSQIIPILSSMGIKTYPIPTVILSTHSGGYESYTYHDLTDHMVDQGLHWKSLGVKFDAIYSGFLGSPDQIVIVEDFIDYFRKDDSIILVDPVMGDQGQIYSSVDKDIIDEMRKLVAKSDIITPNLTEAFLLADMDYKANPKSQDLKKIIERISSLGAKSIVITSYPYSNDLLANIVYQNGRLRVFSSKRLKSDFPGTGDIFASTLLGAYLNNKDLNKATKIASQFVASCIKNSMDEDYSHRSGVLLESNLHQLYKYNEFLE
ncbi:MAG: pyridoxamine kinase [Tissierellia bacterium]|nr:pyridoxamine kinase [Tissierellia bacterium]